MRHFSRSGLLLVGLIVLTSVVASAAEKYVYVHDRSTMPRLFAFELKASGKLTPVPGSPFSVPGSGGNVSGQRRTLAYSPDKQVLVVESAFGVSTMKVAKDGSLQVVPGSFFTGTGSGLLGVACVRKGGKDFVYAPSFLDDVVHGWRMKGDGSLVQLPGSPFAAGNSPQGVVEGGNCLFVMNTLGFSVSNYDVEGSGTLTPAALQPVSTVSWTGTTPELSFDGRTLYVADSNDRLIVTLKKSKSGAGLTRLGLALMPANFNLDIRGIAVSKKNLVVAFGQGINGKADLAFLAREKKHGFLVPLSTRSSSVQNVEAASFDPGGKRLIVASNGKVRSFDVKTSNGKVTTLDTEDISAAYVTDVMIVSR